ALPHAFVQATEAEVDIAAQSAAAAFPVFRNLSAEKRAQFLDAIADELDALGDDFVATVCRETALPAGRIQGERGRTSGQMRLRMAGQASADSGGRVYRLAAWRQRVGEDGVRASSADSGVRRDVEHQPGGKQAQPQLFKADFSLLLNGDELLQEEVFGPTTIIIEVEDEASLKSALGGLRGQLTATNYPDALLPEALQNANPLKIRRAWERSERAINLWERIHSRYGGTDDENVSPELSIRE
nr:hypothetical protein [Tanacetum cinerariifolium]